MVDFNSLTHPASSISSASGANEYGSNNSSSSTLRSCIKKQNSRFYKKDASRRVHFQDHHEEKAIEVVSDLWVKKSTLKKSCYVDYQSVKHNKHVQDYLYAYDLAYLEIKNGHGRVSKVLQQVLIQGAGKGYRSLERYYLCESGSRRETRRGVITSILSQYRRLSSKLIDWEEQLHHHSKKLTRRSRQWAIFLGRVDAKVAAVEYSAITVSLSHRSQALVQGRAVHRLDDSPDGRRRSMLLAQEQPSSIIVMNKSDEIDLVPSFLRIEFNVSHFDRATVALRH